MLKRFIIILCSFLLTCSLSYGQAFNSKSDQLFIEIEKHLQTKQKTDIKDVEIIEYKQQLRDIQQESESQIIKLEQQKQVQTQYIETLGPAPDKDKGEKEVSQVSKIRQKINDQLVNIDGKIKAAKLNILKIDDLNNSLNTLQQENLQSRLAERMPSPFMPNSLGKSWLQISKILQDLSFDTNFTLEILLICFLLGITIPITHFLNQHRQYFYSVTLQKVSHRLIIQLMLASIIIMKIKFLGNTQVKNFPELINLTQAISTILLAFSLYEFLGKVKFNNTSQSDNQGYVRPIWRVLKRKFRQVILLAIPLSIIGFTEFSVFFLFNSFSLILAVILFVVLRLLMMRSLNYFQEKTTPTEEIDPSQPLAAKSIVIIEPLLAFVIMAITFFLWGVDFDEVTLLFEQYATGISIGHLTFNFQDIGAALFSFILIYSFFKLIKWFLASRVFPNANLDGGVVNAILTIWGYIGIALAIISAGGVLGFDATNFALVAGALSVGIGFGLQTIFSNFVSGLILLFERPFKVGDWVLINDHQGIIKKISVRSTEIETFQRSSVIVPNSQMISDIVINRTLHNATTRLEIAVGVAYGSDINKVKALLLECAAEASNILNYPAPFVIFQNFGESSLDFELRCFSNDVHSSLSNKSNLRFLIDQKFRENHIEIPFPQRDIHIRAHV